MSFTTKDIEKVAHLARLTLSDDNITAYTPQLARILGFIEKMSEVNTQDVSALSHPLDIHQPLRQDAITEADQRRKFQSIAPHVEAGLYLVPKVIEEV